MKIIVEAALEKGKIAEWTMIEFQGKFTLNDQPDGPFTNEFIGDVNYAKDGTPFFLNGYRIVYGQEIVLRKPVAVITKAADDENSDYLYVVKAIVRKKVIFKERPNPVVRAEVPKNNG